MLNYHYYSILMYSDNLKPKVCVVSFTFSNILWLLCPWITQFVRHFPHWTFLTLIILSLITQSRTFTHVEVLLQFLRRSVRYASVYNELIGNFVWLCFHQRLSNTKRQPLLLMFNFNVQWIVLTSSKKFKIKIYISTLVCPRVRFVSNLDNILFMKFMRSITVIFTRLSVSPHSLQKCYYFTSNIVID